jgi:FkbM family methyltransferase
MNLAPNHCADVLAGIYDLPVDFKSPPTILDLGANLGAYCQWASERWPGCRIIACEPHPDNFELLEALLRGRPLPNVTARNVAVGRADGAAFLFEGRNNCGECSLEHGVEQVDAGVTVPVMDAAALPPAQLIKIDTEGSEVPILERLLEAGRLNQPVGYSLEFHSATDRRKIDSLMAGYTLISGVIYGPTRGVLNYLRTDLLSA